MRSTLVLAAFLLVWRASSSRPAGDDDSVVSVYTTLPSAGGAGAGASVDVYRQIADNIAERITQPFYRFFGLGNSSQAPTTTRRPFEHIELDTPDSNTTDRTNPNRDVEELSLDAIQKSEKKPEKFTLFSSYLPVKQNFELNNTFQTNDSLDTNDDNLDTNDNTLDTKDDLDTDDNSLELDDVDSDDAGDSGREGPFVYILELMGSIIQLLWGGFLAIFKPGNSNSEP